MQLETYPEQLYDRQIQVHNNTYLQQYEMWQFHFNTSSEQCLKCLMIVYASRISIGNLSSLCNYRVVKSIT